MNRILTSKKALAAFLGTAVVELTTNRCMSVLRRLILTMLLVFPLMLLAAPPAKTVPPSQSSHRFAFDVDPSKSWNDTKIDLRQGERLRFDATGIVGYHHGKEFGPEGKRRGFSDLVRNYALPDAGRGALIARVGSGESTQPLLIGESFEWEVTLPGRLYLGLNQSAKDAENASGNFHVTIAVLNAGGSSPTPSAKPAETPLTAVPRTFFDELPRRVTDRGGKLGDMVNVLLVGYKDQVLEMFKAAGWVQVDSSVEGTVLTAVSDTLARKNYLTMPMSRLYLFGRSQDYGLVHAEPLKVAKSRHHLRLWKSTSELDGRPLWCVAATHDIGFERDKRVKVLPTHKIDPNVDQEREYVNETLSATGSVAESNHIRPSQPVTDAVTASGGEFHSDGRELVLVLRNDTAQP
jgi:LssY C-terminus